MRAGIGIRRIEQFVDRIVRLAPQPRDQSPPSVHRADQHPVEQLLRTVVIGAAQYFAQDAHGLHDPLGIAFSQMLPQAHAGRAMAVAQQFVLAPPDQRRDEQAGERKIVERLRGKAQRRHQILHRQRIAQSQAIDPGDGNTVTVKPRDDQRRQLAPLLYQDHDIASRGAARIALRQCEALARRIEPLCHLLRDTIGQPAIVAGKPAFTLAVIVLALRDPDDLPQADQSRLRAARMRVAALVETETVIANRVDRPVDEAEHLLVRAIAAPQPVFLQPANVRRTAGFARGLRSGIQLVAEVIARLAEVFRAGALEPENRLLVVADCKDGAHRIALRPRAVEVIVGQRLDDAPLRRIGILRFVDEDMVETAVELVADPLGHRAVRQQAGGAGDKVVEIDQPLALLRLMPDEREGAPGLELRSKECSQLDQRGAFADLRHGLGHLLLIVRKDRIGLLRPRQLARRSVLLEQCSAETLETSSARVRITGEPVLNEVGAFLPGLGGPCARGGQAGAQGRDGKGVVRTGLPHPCSIGIGRNAEKAVDARLHRRLPASRSAP